MVDGDTVWLRTAVRVRVKSRIEGIDAPESCQDQGTQATEALKALVDHRSVRVEWLGQDVYHRALVRLWVDGQDVGETLVARGLAWSYAWHQQTGRYDNQEAQARRAGLGLFGQAQAPVRPSVFRRTHRFCH